MRDNSSVLCLTRRSSAAVHEAGDTLSLAMHPSVGFTDNCIASSFTEQRSTDKLDSSAVLQNGAAVCSTAETPRRSSAVADINCSVVDTVARNHCSRTQRRTSLNEAVVTHFSAAGLHNGVCVEPSEQCQRDAWKRTKSHDMSVPREVVVL